ncbi:MAG: sugar ABC transporter ATP-binding protein, partial [Phycisphaeraceae bacterium]|nr:sugar ABC transporter ATP-binding protein [Phycisphaeraceae bacterium]
MEDDSGANQESARLQVTGLSKRFGPTVALDNVDLSVAGGEVLALIGENGAGKSTLIKALSGVLQPDAGEMTLEGRRYRPARPVDGRQRGVAVVYQELSLAPHLTVAENILLGMEPTTMGWLRRSAMRDRARAALARLGIDELDPARPVSELPVATRQMVEIARGLVVADRAGEGGGVMIFDEPTSSLGAEEIDRLFDVIGSLREQGHAIIYISHFLEEVRAVADRFVVLRDGRHVGEGEVAAVSDDELVAMMVGREVEQLYPHGDRTPGDVVLTIDGLAGRRRPVDASLELRRGEVVGIGGLVGAGRSEMLRAIFGLESVVAGKVTVHHVTGPVTPRQRWANGVGLVSEDRKEEGLALTMSVAD